MLGFFVVIRNKSVFIELQLSQSIKTYNVLHFNLFHKILIYPLTNQFNEPSPLIIINIIEK